MCWNTETVERGTPRKAEEDIRVYKVCLCDRLEDGRIALASANSYFQGFTYVQGRTYVSSDFAPYNSVERKFGFHSYSYGCRFVDMDTERPGLFKYGVVFPGKSYASGERYGVKETGYIKTCCQDWTCIRLAECVIPEGSLYCVNENGEYISDTIRMEKVLTYGEWKERHPE